MESRFKSLIPRYDDSGEVLGQKLAHMATFKAFFKDFDQLLGGAGHTEAALKAMDGVTEEELKLYQTMASVFSLYGMAEEIPATTNALRGANEQDFVKLSNGEVPRAESQGNKYSWSAYIDYLTLAESETDKTCKSLDQFVNGEGEVHIPRPEIHSANFLTSIMMGPAMMDRMKQTSNDLYKEQQENINNNELHLGKKFKLKIENGKASNIA